ncbi:hypothetical protein EON65_27670 [archaeon]|nr:MAG: hypothetical protein EON65_27670 [archaeon]
MLLRGKKDILLTIETTIATNAIYAFVYVLGLANEICAPMQTALPRQVGRRLLQEILGRAHYFCFNSFLQQAAGRPFTQVSWEVTFYVN